MRWFGLKLYDAALWVEPEVEPVAATRSAGHALALRYARAIDAGRLVDTSIDEMRRIGGHDEASLARWRTQLMQALPSVAAGDTLAQIAQDYGTTTEAEAALAALVAVGRGRWVWPPAGPAGGRPGKRFVLSTKPPENRPPVYDTPADGPENAGSVDCRRVDNENAEPPTSPWAGMVELDGDGLTAVERAARYRAEVAHEA
mgnify:CR=1 FL=1